MPKAKRLVRTLWSSNGSMFLRSGSAPCRIHALADHMKMHQKPIGACPMSVSRGVAVCLVALCLSAGLLGGCSTLPSLANRSTSTALLDTATTQLGRAIAPLVDAHPGNSGIYPLPDG